MLAALCCVFAVLLGVLGLGVYLAFERRKGDLNEPGA
jgi:hypothetical protein